MKKTSKVLSALLVLAMIACMSAVSAIPASAASKARYIVLAIDTSGSTSSSLNNNRGKTTLDAEKEYAKKLVKANLDPAVDVNKQDRIAVINFDSNAYRVVDFTNDIDALNQGIDSLDYRGTTNFYDMFELVNTIFSEAAQTKDFSRALYVCSDGLPYGGKTLQTYEYTKNDYYDYDYANAALKYDRDVIWTAPTAVYTLGAYNSMGDELDFAQRFMKDLCHAPGYSQIITTDELMVFDPIVIITETPEEPAPADDGTPKSPKTGVENNYAAMLAVLAVSGFGAFALTKKSKKED